MDEEVVQMSRTELESEVRRLRDGIRKHRDSSGQELCWHHPQLWGLLPEKTDPLPRVPDWPEFLRGCVKYRQSLDELRSAAPPVTFNHPTPELPVEDVERAQRHYRDVLGFSIGWLDPSREIGAVSHGEAAIFFRKRSRPFEPAVHWVFAEDIDALHETLRSSGAKIVEPLDTKPWGLRQFTLEDVDGNRFYFHCD